MQPTFKFKESENGFVADQHKVEYSDLQNMQAAYLAHPDCLSITYFGGNKAPLKALRLPVEEIRKIIDRDDNIEVKYLIAFFGHRQEPDGDHFNITFGGVCDEPGNPGNDRGLLLKDQLYDYCEPCPNKCPNNL